jgi:hypothetical protein
MVEVWFMAPGVAIAVPCAVHRQPLPARAGARHHERVPRAL